MASHAINSWLTRIYTYRERALVVLAVATILAVPLRSLLTETKKLKGIEGMSRLHSDKDHVNGLSYGEYVNKDQNEFICHLVKSYRYPFCGYTMHLSAAIDKGLDMSKYDTIILDIDYVGKSNTLRFYLRNFNPAYSSIEEYRSTKYHLIEFEPKMLAGRFEVDLNNFKVANWWITKNKIPFSLSHTDLSNVPMLQLQTGSKAPMGEHRFKVNGIYLYRQLLPSEEFYFALIVIWVATTITFLAIRLFLQNTVIESQKFRAMVLEKENEVLDRIAENLDRKSKTDALTGTVNRSGMEEVVKNAIEHFRQTNETFSFVLFDIDFFKKINDDHGHVVGDQVLMELANYVRENTRDEDILGRWGGEEFLIVCLRTEQRKSIRLAEKLCNGISHFPFTAGIKVTCSFGVAAAVDGDNAESLFAIADKALYRAKESGRNRVVTADREELQ